MKKLNYLILAMLFLGFMTFASCTNTGKKTETTTPAEEVIEEVTEEAVEAVTDTAAMDEMTEEEVEEEPAMGGE